MPLPFRYRIITEFSARRPPAATAQVGRVNHCIKEVAPGSPDRFSLKKEGFMVWDARGRPLRALLIEGGRAPNGTQQIDLTCDGKIVFTYGESICAWSGRGAPWLVVRLEASPSYIVASDDGARVIAWRDGREAWVRIVRLADGAVEGSFNPRLGDEARRAEVSPDGTLALFSDEVSCQSGSDVLWFKLLRVATGEELASDSHTCDMEWLTFAPDGERLLLGCPGQPVRDTYNIQKRKWKRTEEVMPNPGQARLASRDFRALFSSAVTLAPLAVSLDGTQAATTDRLDDLATGRSRKLHRAQATAMAVAFIGEAVHRVFGGTVKRNRAQGGDALEDLPALPVAPSKAAYSLDGEVLALCRDVRQGADLWLVDARTHEVLAHHRSEHMKSVSSMAWAAPQRHLLLLGDHRGHLHHWDTRSGEVQTVHSGRAGFLWPVAVSPDGRWTAAILSPTSNEHGPALLHHDGERVLAKHWPRAHREGGTALAFDHTGDRLAVGRLDWRVDVFALPSLERTHQLEGHIGPVSDLCFAPGPDTLVSSSSREGRVIAWLLD